MELNQTMILLLGAIVLVSVVLVVYLLMGRKKKQEYLTMIEELEVEKYALANKPIMFEISKLQNVRKSERIVSLVEEWSARWKGFEEEFAIVDDNLAFAEETIAEGDFDKVDELLAVTREDISRLEAAVNTLAEEIEGLKTSESRNRAGIVNFRETLASLQETYDNSQEVYRDVKDVMAEQFKAVHQLFESFDTHMEASSYDLADDVSHQIQEKIDVIKHTLDKIPMYIETIKLDITPLLDSVLESHSEILKEGVFLKHLNIEAGVLKCKKELDRIPALLQKFEFDAVETLLVDVSKSAKDLREKMKHEVDVKESFAQDLEQLKLETTYVVKEQERLQQRYDEIKDHCLMRRDDDENFTALGKEISMINLSVTNLVPQTEVLERPISELHSQILGFLAQLGEMTEQLRIFDSEIDALYQGSQDVQKEVHQLLDTVNYLRSNLETEGLEDKKIRFRSLVDKASNQMNLLLELIAQVPLDVASVKTHLITANDVIDKAKNEILVSVEQVRLAERLLVYGNRYVDREGIYLMDLTIAEDQFHQGNYEQVIDKMYKLLTDVEGSPFFEIFEQIKQELGCQMI